MKTYGSDKGKIFNCVKPYEYSKYDMVVMFGTNFPQLNLERTLKNVDALGLPQQVKDKFLWKNACNVFKLDPPGSLAKL